MMKGIFTKSKFNILLISLFSAFLFPLAGIAQDHCGTDEMYKVRIKNNPDLLKRQRQADSLARNASMQQSFKTSSVRVIPVVFHVIHEYGPENISKKRIIAEIDSMNKCYRGWNGDTSNVRPEFKHLIADNNVQFVLAELDPKGNCSDGIDRVASPLTYNAGENVKVLVQWDPTKYFNIWVVASINK